MVQEASLNLTLENSTIFASLLTLLLRIKSQCTLQKCRNEKVWKMELKGCYRTKSNPKTLAILILPAKIKHYKVDAVTIGIAKTLKINFYYIATLEFHLQLVFMLFWFLTYCIIFWLLIPIPFYNMWLSLWKPSMLAYFTYFHANKCKTPVVSSVFICFIPKCSYII